MNLFKVHEPTGATNRNRSKWIRSRHESGKAEVLRYARSDQSFRLALRVFPARVKVEQRGKKIFAHIVTGKVLGRLRF